MSLPNWEALFLLQKTNKNPIKTTRKPPLCAIHKRRLFSYSESRKTGDFMESNDTGDLLLMLLDDDLFWGDQKQKGSER